MYSQKPFNLTAEWRPSSQSPEDLRRAYRDSVNTVPANIVKWKIVDASLADESCYICVGDWNVGDEGATLRCDCPNWT